jgi:hypothetical protein
LEEKNKAKTNVYVMTAEVKVIGGYCFPNIEGLMGSVYSLEGKTMEEVTGLTLNEFSESWKRKHVN